MKTHVMEYVDTLPRCEREIGSAAKGWQACGRPATVLSDREFHNSLYRLYFCQRHAKHAGQTDGRTDVRVVGIGRVIKG